MNNSESATLQRLKNLDQDGIYVITSASVNSSPERESSVATLIIEENPAENDYLEFYLPQKNVETRLQSKYSISRVLLLVLSIVLVTNTVFAVTKTTAGVAIVDTILCSYKWSLTMFLLLQSHVLISEYNSYEDLSYLVLFAPLKYGVPGCLALIVNFILGQGNALHTTSAPDSSHLYIYVINLLTFDDVDALGKTGLVFIITFLYWSSMFVCFMILLKSVIPSGWKSMIFNVFILYFSWVTYSTNAIMFMAFLIKGLGQSKFIKALEKGRIIVQLTLLGLSVIFLWPGTITQWIDQVGFRTQLSKPQQFFTISNVVSSTLILLAIEIGDEKLKMVLHNLWIQKLSVLSNGIIFFHPSIIGLLVPRDSVLSLWGMAIGLSLVVAVPIHFLFEYPLEIAFRMLWNTLQIK